MAVITVNIDVPCLVTLFCVWYQFDMQSQIKLYQMSSDQVLFEMRGVCHSQKSSMRLYNLENYARTVRL